MRAWCGAEQRSRLNKESYVGVFGRALFRHRGLKLLALVFEVPAPALCAQLQTRVDCPQARGGELLAHLMQDTHTQVLGKSRKAAACDALEQRTLATSIAANQRITLPVRDSQRARHQQLQAGVSKSDVIDPNVASSRAGASVLPRDASPTAPAPAPALATCSAPLPLRCEVVAAVQRGLLPFDQGAGAADCTVLRAGTARHCKMRQQTMAFGYQMNARARASRRARRNDGDC
jgi:hypothetical protein